MKEAETNSVK